MVAKNHILTGTASAVCLGAVVYTLAYNVDVGIVSTACSRLIEQAAGVNSLYKLCAIPLFLLGLILPDCDLRTSVVGRFFYLPCKHRTWTHSVWFVLPSVIAGIWFLPLWALAFAIVIHDFWDGLSNGGVCFFYPFTKYRDLPSGAHFKPGHKGFYATGTADETFMTVIACCMAALAVGYAYLFFKMRCGV